MVLAQEEHFLRLQVDIVVLAQNEQLLLVQDKQFMFVHGDVCFLVQ